MGAVVGGGWEWWEGGRWVAGTERKGGRSSCGGARLEEGRGGAEAVGRGREFQIGMIRCVKKCMRGMDLAKGRKSLNGWPRVFVDRERVKKSSLRSAESPWIML